VVGTWDYNGDQTMRIYVDGVDDTNSSVNHSDLITYQYNIPARIGMLYEDGDGYDYNGTIDDVMIFNRSLSADEVRGLYANTSSRYLDVNFTNLTGSIHTFQAYTQDRAGNVNTTNQWSVSIDTIKPSITLNSPNNSYVATSSTINFNWTIVDNLDSSVLCNLTIDSIVNVSDIVSTNNSPTNQTVGGLGPGIHLWNVTCWDNASNINISATRSFTINAPLYISFEDPTPGNSSYQSEDSIYVNVSSSDSGSNVSTFIDFDNSLVSWWRFDDVNSSGDATDYMNRNNGSVVNATQTDAGYFGKGFEFDGDGDYINVSNLPSSFLNSGESTTATLSAWVYPKNTSGGIKLVLIIGEQADKNCLYLDIGAGNYRFLMYNDSSQYALFSQSQTAVYDQWAFLTGTWNSTFGCFYLNGNLIECNPGTPLINFSKMVIGLIGNQLTQSFNGTIDDVMIFNRSLSAAEVAALYANQTSRYYI